MTRMGVCAATALLLAGTAPARAASQAWTAGWDNFNEPLNFANSGVSWTLAAKTKVLTVTFTLVGATPGKLYQVAALLFNQCPSVPAQFGQFPQTGSFGCAPYTRQGVTLSTSNAELGVVTTDASGNGTYKLAVGPLASGVYKLEFVARNGAGCAVGGGGNDCAIDFQAPGPVFGDTLTVKVP